MEPVCGRPLGLALDWNGNLIVADAYFGLLSFDKEGHKQILLKQVEGSRLVFPNAIAIDHQKKKIYFTDSSSRFQRRDVAYEVLEAGSTGRLIEYDSATQEARVLQTGLPFPNGIVLTKDNKSLIMCSTTRALIYSYHLSEGTLSVLLENLPGLPDNIRPRPLSPSLAPTYWVGMSSKRASPFSLIDLGAFLPWSRIIISKLLPSPSWLTTFIQKFGLIIEIDEHGNIIQTLQDPSGYTPFISEVEEIQDDKGNIVLFIGSWFNRFLTRFICNAPHCQI